MSATTLDAIVDAVRSLVAARDYEETVVPFTFDLTPSQSIDRAFRIATGAPRTRGQVGQFEEQVVPVDIWTARRHGQDVTATMQAIRREAHSLTAAVVQAGITSAAWEVVEDGGRGLDIAQEPGRVYTVGRLTLPITYEAAL